MAPKAQAELLANELRGAPLSLAPTDSMFVKAGSEGDRIPSTRAHQAVYPTIDIETPFHGGPSEASFPRHTHAPGPLIQ